MDYQTIRVEQKDRVGWITLHRPEALNALNAQMMREVVAAADAFDADESVGAIVITGSTRAFAAGADVKEMETKTPEQMRWHFADWDRFACVRTPVIAAVSGFALGGGCELAMMCDIILAADNAKFGQPELNLAVIPGMGGTQRLTRAVGAYKAADLVLTGRMMGAAEAERCGLVSRVIPADDLLSEALKTAESIAAKSLPSTMTAKSLLNAALETPLREGLRTENFAFVSVFGLDDRAEGMAAFRQKRKPEFIHR
ncbi:enoyl-CoA hydratase/isomerase family protein [Microbacterium lacus]|uniref:enoyl-CoA hydratase-related protein n=1 Tax=Microbacterium lacus TaxID=415217 RepID=UPI00385026D2